MLSWSTCNLRIRTPIKSCDELSTSSWQLKACLFAKDNGSATVVDISTYQLGQRTFTRMKANTLDAFVFERLGYLISILAQRL
jgi:hypothetical protein